MDDYFSKGKSGRRGVGFILVLAFHGLLIWGLMNGLARTIVEKVKEPFEVAEIDEPPPPEDDTPPPPPPPTVEPPPFVPPPDFDIAISTAPSDTQITQTTTKPPPSGPTVGVRPDPKHPPTKPDYPPSAKRLEQEGVVGLLLLVGPDGRVIEAQVEKSSGFPALDAAATKEAKRWRFLPAQQEGKPIQAWHRVNLRFRLEDA